jgi:Carbon-nitrogen hydrolase
VRSTRVLGVCCLLAAVGCGSESEPTKPDRCSAFHFSDQGGVRAFVVGHHELVFDAESYASYEASYRRHLDAIAPCLSKERPNLIVFPEDAALGALLIGSRGSDSRAAGSSTEAFVQILTSYETPFQYYQAKFPAAGLRRQLVLALTDVVWRAFERTFSGIARDYGVWVMSNANVAPHQETNDPTLTSELGDPEAGDPGRAFVATDPTPYNSAYLFDPEGALAGHVDKVFLTDPEENDLDLANGSLSGLTVLNTPFARIGVATSRDAFYPPLMQRLEDLGADLVIQPEAFSGWTVEEQPGDWLPDVFLSSGWLHTQKYTTFSHSLTSVYTGNFFELVFDGQAHMTEVARPNHGLGRYVGQDPIVGFGVVGPWVEADPGIADETLSLDARRAALRTTGAALLPGSGAPSENGYVDSVVAMDLDVLPAPAEVTRDPALTESQALTPAAGGEQRNADVTRDAAGGAIAVFQDDRSGLFRIRAATSSDGGQSFSSDVQVEPGGGGVQQKPAVCSDGTRVAVVWQEGEPGAERVTAVEAPKLGAPFAPPVAVAPGEAGAQWDPDCGFDSSGDLFVAWTGFENDVPRVHLARRASGSAAFDPAVSVDPSTSGAPRLGGAQVEPAVSETGGSIVWLDYRDHSWDVYAARFDGTSVSDVTRIDGIDASDTRERLHGEPRVEADGSRRVAAWTDLAERRGHADVALAVSDDGGLSWSKRRVVPGGPASEAPRSSGGKSMPRYRPALALDAGGGIVSFQDLSADKSAIFGASLDASGMPSAPARIDDTADAAVKLTRPRATRLAGATLLVWEDTREGARRIYFTRLP